MATFDPDAYLAQQSFDPDAYLKSVNVKPAPQPEQSAIGNLGAGLKRGVTDILDTIATQGYGRLTGNKDLIGGEA